MQQKTNRCLVKCLPLNFQRMGLKPFKQLFFFCRISQKLSYVYMQHNLLKDIEDRSLQEILLSSVRRLCTLLRKPREKRHCISAWLGGGREVTKDLKQEMILMWICKNELFTKLISQGRTVQRTAHAKAWGQKR